MFNKKSILITGGTGSFGKNFTKLLLTKYKTKKIIIFSRDEMKQFEMAQKFSPSKYPCLRYFIGDVRDRDRLELALNNIDSQSMVLPVEACPDTVKLMILSAE